MRTRSKAIAYAGAAVAALVGVGFFNTIIGVFGPTLSIVALLLFIALVLPIARIAQPEE